VHRRGDFFAFRTLRERASQAKRAIAGFTLLELLVIVVIIGIFAGMMVPSWSSMMNTQRLNRAQDEVYQAMRQAQNNATHHHLTWQASFRDTTGTVEWAIHPVTTDMTGASWNPLDGMVRLDDETTLQTASGGIRRIQFNDEGRVNGQLGRLTLSGKMGGKTKRCVIVSTLLGVIRTGKDNARAQDGKFCY